MCFSNYIDLQDNKACGRVPQVLASIFENSDIYHTHFTQVAALGKVKSYSRIVVLRSLFTRRV